MSSIKEKKKQSNHQPVIQKISFINSAFAGIILNIFKD
jgi:hypothetical protein